MSLFHRHTFDYLGSKRLDLTYFEGQRNMTFMVTVYRCADCLEVKSTASDMQEFLDMKNIDSNEEWKS